MHWWGNPTPGICTDKMDHEGDLLTYSFAMFVFCEKTPCCGRGLINASQYYIHRQGTPISFLLKVGTWLS